MFNLEESLQALVGHDEFVVKKYNGLVCLDYILCFPGTFDVDQNDVEKYGLQVAERNALIRRNCRGMVFSEATGELVSLPLHKFFNVDQVEATKFENIKHFDARIYEKCDGSMIHFFIHPETKLLQASTCRSTETSQAKESLALVKKNPDLENKILTIIKIGFTPVFEYVAPHNQIVVQYRVPKLIYLISRDRLNGTYHFHNFEDSAKTFDFPFSTIHEFLDKKEFEGYVCHLKDEHGNIKMLVKAKTPWYMERHKAVDAMMRPAYKLYQVVFDGIMDDLIATAPEVYKPQLNKIYEEAQRDLLNEKIKLDNLFDKLFKELLSKNTYSQEEIDARFPTEEARVVTDKRLRKDFVMFVKDDYKKYFGRLMNCYMGRNSDNLIKEDLMAVYEQKYNYKLFETLEFESCE